MAKRGRRAGKGYLEALILVGPGLSARRSLCGWVDAVVFDCVSRRKPGWIHTRPVINACGIRTRVVMIHHCLAMPFDTHTISSSGRAASINTEKVVPEIAHSAMAEPSSLVRPPPDATFPVVHGTLRATPGLCPIPRCRDNLHHPLTHLSSRTLHGCPPRQRALCCATHRYPMGRSSGTLKTRSWLAGRHWYLLPRS